MTLRPAAGTHLTPIPIGEAVASLSAILLDDDYYTFIIAGRRKSDGLSWVARGSVDPAQSHGLAGPRRPTGPWRTRTRRTSANTRTMIIRLSQLLSEEVRIPLPAKIAGDLAPLSRRHRS